jgi:peptide-methionine (S)-S-oxide reductase
MATPTIPDSGGPLTTDIATLGGGCFWCLEAVFQELRGVQNVESGYSGGQTPAGSASQPTYEQVCSGRTGHAEVVQVAFDQREISYSEILNVFFAIHDPTTLNRQGADAGTQYRSVIFYHNSEQKLAAEKKIAELNSAQIWDAPIVTEIAPLRAFYQAEDFHQNYFKSHPTQHYCQAVISPKVAKFRKQFAERLLK